MKTLYKKTRTGKTQQWCIAVKDCGDSGFPEVWIEHGLADGKKQTTFDIIKEGVNIGKSNETSPLEQARLIMERKILKQLEEGYKKSIDDIVYTQSIDFDSPLLKELCFYKPQNSITDSKISKLEAAQRLFITLKEDGLMYIIRRSKKFGTEIYSRRMELETSKFPHIEKDFDNLSYGTILLGEMVVEGCKNHMEAYKKATKICRSDTEKALERQKEFGLVQYKPFDIAFYNHKNMLITTPYSKRYELCQTLLRMHNLSYAKMVKHLDMSHSKAMSYIKINKKEGMVLWDAEGIMKEDEAYTFNGKAYRPNVLWKSKAKLEDDFIVKWNPAQKIGEYGAGKNKGKLKNVFLYQLDENGQEIFLGKCGGGLTDEQRDFYSNANMFPRVWRIEYDAIQPKTGSLRYPVFSSDRTLSDDKTIKECVISDIIKKARKVK